MRRVGLGAAIGAAFSFFFDPQSGARRRNMTRDRVLAFFRRSGRTAAQAGRGVAADAYGVSQKVKHVHEEPKDFDDATLAHKVESEIFRPADVPKGKLNVNVENGVVYLRGELEGPDQIDQIVKATQAVEGVTKVESLLHTPGTPAPTK